MIEQAIEQYAKGADALNRAIRGLNAADLDAFPVPGTWSIRQVVVHVMESDLIGTDRMKRIAAMDRPLLIGYDENAFITPLHPERADAAARRSASASTGNSRPACCGSLARDAFDRWGVHNEKGKVTLLELVEGYAGHVDHHMKFIVAKRAALGKTM